MNRYSKNFTLKDIFNNPLLKNKIPLINYKETEKDGKVSVRTSPKSIPSLVYSVAQTAARPYYKPLVATKTADTIVIGGTLDGDYDTAYNAIYGAINAQKEIMSMTANNVDMIRHALKESEKNKRRYGTDSRLYLRAQSMEEIQGMSTQQLLALMTNIMENIVYGDNFPETKAKYQVEQMPTNSPFTFLERTMQWKRRVGDL